MNYLFLFIFSSLSFYSNAQAKGFTPTNANSSERRLALVIGNKDYTAIGALKNPINDATDVSKAFQQLGFEVTTITNTDYKRMIGAFNQFTKNLLPTDVVVFYYSGHGISYDGKNYLIPTDASITCLEEIEENAHSLGRFLTAVEAKSVKNTFVFLDACRNLPNIKKCNVTTKDVSLSKGLVRPSNNPSGSMIIYATREGDTADDNATERNGLFTSEFLKYITLPNLGLRQILDRTKRGVETRSNKRQSPARYDELSDDFVFIQSVTPTIPQPTEVTPPVVIPSNVSPVPTPSIVKKADLLPYEPEMVFVAGGSFQMGSNDGEFDEKPVHQVALGDYSIGKYEITVGEYLVFCDATNSHYPQWLELGSNFHIETGRNTYYKSKGYSRSSVSLPIVGVSWDDAVAYCKWLSSKTGKTYRLPTEAEWEYAARGGRSSLGYIYSGSNIAESAGWIYVNSALKPHEVGLKQANELGLYDMSGNVLEWCSDGYDFYSSGSQDNPKGSNTDIDRRVLRGGGWINDPEYSRVAYRYRSSAFSRDFNSGFRVCVPSFQ